MLAVAQYLAVAGTAIFAGAALYVSFVEHPARLACDTRTAATQWAPSYARGSWMQATLALISPLAAVVVWYQGGDIRWLMIAALIFVAVPYTIFVVYPINDKLLAPGRDLASSETRALLVRWGHLHAVRSALGLAAFLFALAVSLE